MRVAFAVPGRALRAVLGLVGALVLASTSCTYGPEVHAAGIEQAVHVPDTRTALVVVRRDVLRRPTGLAAFPDGGRVRYVTREAFLYRVDALARSATRLHSLNAPGDLRGSFRAWVRGLEGDTLAYYEIAGCPESRPCRPEVETALWFAVRGDGRVDALADAPQDPSLPGVMLAARPGEEHFLRVSATAEVLRVRLDPGAPFTPLFRVQSDGSLGPP